MVGSRWSVVGDTGLLITDRQNAWMMSNLVAAVRLLDISRFVFGSAVHGGHRVGDDPFQLYLPLVVTFQLNCDYCDITAACSVND